MTITPQHLAKYFKFLVSHKSDIKTIRVDSFYNSHKKIFTGLFDFFKETPDTAIKYLDFVVKQTGKNVSNVTKLLDKDLLSLFLENLTHELQNKKIRKAFLSSVEFVVDMCKKTNCASSSDYIDILLMSEMLPQLYMTGVLSSHYLAAIPDFENRVKWYIENYSFYDEIAVLINNLDKLRNDIFIALKSNNDWSLDTPVDSLKLTDEKL